jgi:hypothetical protein
MLDDFLREENTDSFLNEIAETPKLQLEEESDAGFLGMTAFQRFIIAILFFLMVVIIGAFCLLLTGTIGIPLG